MTYIGGEGTGYEAVKAPLYIGLAWTDQSPGTAHEWEAQDSPILSIHDKDAQWWEAMTQYKSTVYWDKGKTLGAPFVMFYNAGGRHPETGLKGERVGIALSKDMKKWKRYPGNPVFAHEADGTITGDAHIQKMGDVYVMFYFSAFEPSRKYKAFNTFAASYDLVHWTDWKGADLIIPSKNYDELFAHKSYVIKHDGVVYHFYCAVNDAEQRGIAIATSKPMGRSQVHFPEREVKNRRMVMNLDKGWKTWLVPSSCTSLSSPRRISVLTSTVGAEYFPPDSIKRCPNSFCGCIRAENIPPLQRPTALLQMLKGCADKVVLEKGHGCVNSNHESPETIVVDIPRNWDDYYGYRQLTHGNLHGTAMYTKDFVADKKEGKRYFLRFEGVGTYATVTLNGKDFGRHPVGRTTLTLDVTEALKQGENKLEVKAEHPEMIADMPWVCGGCSSEWGFSEGSQPFGIFRPVVLEVTDEIRIEPFGVHIWNDEMAGTVFVETEVKNYGKSAETVEIVNKFSNADDKQVFRLTEKVTLQPGERKVVKQQSPVQNPVLWSTENPYLYKLGSMVKRGKNTTDEMSTPFGIRTISWPVKRNNGNNGNNGNGGNNGDGRFYLNGVPTFINGVCEYEHQFGQSHAFSHEQVAARVKQIRAAGFNAFRDAHQPHHLDYQTYWDKEGMLWWTQFSAHVWYDTPEFRENFKKLLRQWVKERRNSPSVVMWGLQNESTLPRAFAEECSGIIREMDPTARTMRVITTCNGGEGTDWNVIQNWSGTYGGDVNNYGHELSQKNQLLNGEYGAWRSIGLHAEPGAFDANGVWSEERMCRLMETKIRLAEQAKDSVCGQFQWIFSSHDNPGRRQPDEAYRKIDKVGPFNYKGLVTPWEEPLDVYYMYRANYVPASKDPMVYLASHTWEDRFTTGRRRATIEAYSNCDSVLLYNDAVDGQFLGRKQNHGAGTHFMWEDRDIRYNVLRAVGYYKGEPVAEDILILNGLEKAPNFDALYSGSKIVPTAADRFSSSVLQDEVKSADVIRILRDVQNDKKGGLLEGAEGYTYLYRLNCGGDAYTDTYGQVWAQDNSRYSHSWAESFIQPSDSVQLLSPYQASQRVTNDPIHGTRDWKLFQTFRFGRHKLNFRFPVPDGDYRVELYFTEPWHGTGGSAQTDCEGLRIFDVAVNDKVVLDDLDIWAETGHDGACKKVVNATVKNGILKIDFPEVKAGQAIICGIAIASSADVVSSSAAISPFSAVQYEMGNPNVSAQGFSWAVQDKDVMEKTPKELLPEDKNARTNVTYEAEDAVLKGKYIQKEYKKQTGVFFGKGVKGSITWNISTGLAQVYALRFKYMNSTGKPMKVRMQFIDSKGGVLKEDHLTFAETPGKWRMLSTTTGTFINAGYYKVVLSAPDMDGLALDALDVQ